MVYTPPALNQVNFALSAFTPAISYKVNFEFGEAPPSEEGLPVGSILFDIESGDPAVYLGEPLILNL